jgi:adenylate cyclase
MLLVVEPGMLTQMERRLTAILAADVVGFSRLMGLDEAGTLSSLQAHRKVLDGAIAKHAGRIVKVAGDGLLTEFSSVVNAVACAANIQREMRRRNADVAQDHRIEFRIGINLGDVIAVDEDIFGDGVNVAARLESIAPPGGIIVSASVRDQVGDRLRLPFEDMGKVELKNIARPVHVFRVILEGEKEASALLARTIPKLPNKPSIAVLPFANMSGDPEQEYFADGLVEDLITGLSKVAGLFVIARNSTFTYKGTSPDLREVGRELGVRYVLEGSVRRAGSRLRITGQLIEAATAGHIWADKFEGSMESIFELQDRITEQIVGAIEPSLRLAEIERARHKRPDSLDAYDLYLRAMPYVHANSPAATEVALSLLAAALELDQNYAAAHGYAAWGYEQRYLRSGFDQQDCAAALKHAHNAVSLGPSDPLALSIGAFVHGNITHDYESAIEILDRALKMNANSALAFGFSALANAHSEHHERAIDDATKALRLSPFDPLNYHPYCALALTYFFTERFADATAAAKLALQVNPNFSVAHAYLVASQICVGQVSASRASAKQLMELAPNFTVGNFERMDLFRPALMSALVKALRSAGLPD